MGTNHSCTETMALEQCCTCQHWQPRQDDSEVGRCWNEKSHGEFKGITLWSDGCNHWESNREQA